MDKLKEEITCPLCLDILKDPKVLSCQHVYCKAPCLKGLALQSGDGTISCPECHNVAQVPGSNLDNLPTAFHISRLKEVYNFMRLDIQPDPTLCSKHETQSLDLYCETCQKLVCRDCVLADCLHTEHKYGYVTDVAARHREGLLKALVPAEQLHARVSHSLTTVADVKMKISEQRTTLVGTINTSFDNLIGVLQEQKQHLVQEVEQLSDGKVHAISVQEGELKAAQSKLQQLVTSVKEKVQNDSNEQFLSHKKETRFEISEVDESLADLFFDPIELPHVSVQITTEDELRRLCGETCSVDFLDLLKCTVEGPSLHLTDTGTRTNLALYLKDTRGYLCTGQYNVTAELKTLRNGLVTPACITPMSSGCYQISYETESRGRHELSVKVNGVNITSSPFNVFVRKLSNKIGAPVDAISGLQGPTGLAFADNKLFVSEFGRDVVAVFDHNLKKTGTIGADVLKRPGGISFDQHSIYVSSTGNNKVCKFTKDGRHVKSIGGTGKDPGNFNFPNGNRVSKDNKLYICDSYNHRIQVFDTDLNLVRIIGSKGYRNGRFNWPADVDFDSDGNLYVTDRDNHRVQVLTPEGRHVRNIGKKETLDTPIGIRVLGDMVYVVSCASNCVSVFRKSGEYITRFGEGHLCVPEGIAVDEDGFVYVSSNRGRVVVF